MTSKNNRAPLLSYFKLCVSFHTHWWIQTGVTVRKYPIWVKIDDLFSRVTFKLDRWPWKTIGHLFYATSSFVHHFVLIGDLKLELQSGNAQFGSKSKNFFQGVQPWALTKFPDFSMTFPWPFCGFPWPWDILSAFHYCLNTNFASNLTNHSPNLAITK